MRGEPSRDGLRGLAPDGSQGTGSHGRELARNAAIGDLAPATGLRLQEFTHLLPWEIPALPSESTTAPIPFPVPAGITKGKKYHTTWISYEALAAVRDYVELDRAATVEGSPWQPLRRWGDPLRLADRVSSSKTEGLSHGGPTFGADVTTLLGEYE